MGCQGVGGLLHTIYDSSDTYVRFYTLHEVMEYQYTKKTTGWKDQ